jgi:glycopeptide antibiotics resistance protein
MDFNNAKTILDASAILLCGLIWLGAIAFLRLKKQKSFAYLLLFTLFYAYLVIVLYYTEFAFQSLLILNYLSPGHLMLHGVRNSTNLIPLINLTPKDLKTSLLNMLLFIPLGFGIPLISNVHFRKVIAIGALFSIAIELMQLATGLIANMTFRVADINDVIFNTAGSAIGYAVFITFVHKRTKA